MAVKAAAAYAASNVSRTLTLAVISAFATVKNSIATSEAGESSTFAGSLVLLVVVNVLSNSLLEKFDAAQLQCLMKMS